MYYLQNIPNIWLINPCYITNKFYPEWNFTLNKFFQLFIIGYATSDL